MFDERIERSNIPMTSITFCDLLTIIYVLVDDWYQEYVQKYRQRTAGRKPVFSDSEVITLMLAQEYIPYPSETQFLEFMRANYLALFPKLLDQSQFNRRARSLPRLVEELRRYWLSQQGVLQQSCFLLDTKPIPVVGYKRSKRRSDFLGNAEYGYCASRSLKYFGYKLVMVSTLKGMPIVYDLVPANLDERLAAKAVIDYLSACDIFADMGFIGLEWQSQIFEQTWNLVWTPRRANQYQQNSKRLDGWLSSTRERIEGLFHELQNTGRNIERLLAKTVLGLCTRMIAKITSHLLKHLLFTNFNVKVQSFQAVA
jgi:hypothetical protein